MSATYRSNAIVEAAGRSGGQASDEGHAPTYYPNATESASATPIETAAEAQLRGIDLVLSKSRTVHLRGRVSSTSKSMISVMLVPGGQTGVVGTDESGKTAAKH